MSAIRPSKKVLDGVDVSPLYYVAVLLYIMTRLKTRDQIDELFETLKRVFMGALDDHPPPCHAVILQKAFSLLTACFYPAYCLLLPILMSKAVSRLKAA